MLRTGLIGKKVGMTRVFDDKDRHIPVTVIDLSGCRVVASKKFDTDNYYAVQIGAGFAKNNVNKPLTGHFKKNKVVPCEVIKEFAVDKDALLGSGTHLSAKHFVIGQKVDVTGITIGKGFAGGMKRHNFKGLHATHGVSVSHRSHGSTGQCQDPGRVFKGKKMAGHMGHTQVTLQNLKVIAVYEEEDLILVQGSIPGPSGKWVMIKDAVKSKALDNLPYPCEIKTQVSNHLCFDGKDIVQSNNDDNKNIDDNSIASSAVNEQDQPENNL